MSAFRRREDGKPGSRPKRTRKRGTPTYVVEVPLKVTPRDAHLIDQRLRLTGMLRNSILQTALAQRDALIASDAWQDARAMPRTSDDEKAARNDRMKQLRYDARLYPDGMNAIASEHWRAGPYQDLLDSWTPLALAGEVWTFVNRYMFGQAGRPRFKPSPSRDVVWGNGIKVGIRLKDDCLAWQTKAIQRAPKESKLARKRLRIPLDFAALSGPRRDHLQQAIADGKLLRMGIRREQVRGHVRYVALLCLDGVPYRNAEYLASADAVAGSAVGLDMGVSKIAVATREVATIEPLCSPVMLGKRKEDARRERSEKRAVKRSRAACNQHAYDKKGRSHKGVRQPMTSTRGRRREEVLANTARKNAEHRKQDRAALAHGVRVLGDRFVVEAADYRQWKRREMRWAKILGLTSPGLLHDALRWEAHVTGGSFREIDPWANASTQRCLCGSRKKKSLSERTHQCARCGLVADRDLLPAYLACLLGETGCASLDDLLPVEAQTLGATPDLTGRGSRAGSSGGSPVTGGSNTALDAGNQGIEAGRSGAPAKDVRTGSRATDDSDPTPRRSRHTTSRSSHKSGESSAARKADCNVSADGKLRRSRAPADRGHLR